MNSIQPNTLLPTLIFAPAVIGLLLALVFPTIPRPWREGVIQKIGLATAVISLLAGFWLAWQFDTTQQGFQFVTNLSFGAGTIIPMTFSFGLDGLSLTLIILTAFLIVLALLSGEQSLHQRKSGFVISLLILESFLLGVFGTLDIFLLYVFFEAMLIPMFIVIGIWGGENRTYAAFKFFLYTLAGSVLMLVALIYLYQQAGTSNLPDLLAYVQQNPIALNIQRLLWLAFFASFAVKVPLWPFHTWLPDAHVQAPTGGSVLLAGIQLKMGAYGFLRLSMPLLPQASQDLAWVLAGLAIISIIYTSL
ncbi:MAG: NuoM family protein, partial [Holosporaceae bacterium]